MNKKCLLFLFLASIQSIIFAQERFTIRGYLPNLPNSKLELKGYDGSSINILDTTQSDSLGRFTLLYPKKYIGVSQLYINNKYLNLIFLNNENIDFKWENLSNIEDLQTNSEEYRTFIGGMKTFQDSESKLVGLNYLLPLYINDSIKYQWIKNELNIITNNFPSYIKSLPKKLLARQYLLVRGLIEQMPNTVKIYSWRAQHHVSEFMAIDFKALQYSGLYKELLEGFTNLAEHLPNIKETNTIIKSGIDKVIEDLEGNSILQQDIAQLWFTYLESHNLNETAEYLAKKMIDDKNCRLNEKSSDLFEQYGKMAIGKMAPNIYFDKGLEQKWAFKNLKELKNEYKLVIFGASWCPNCQRDYPSLIGKYKKLKESLDIEIIYISIDSDRNTFKNYYKEAPFVMYCDFKGWETQATKDYHVFATPTYILLSKELKILAKFQSPEQFEDWFKLQKAK